ncbi:MAG: LPS assembly lipoprotein LptE [Aquabacterium sp.]
MKPYAQHRRLALATLMAGALLATAGCGFKLRGQHDMAFRTVQITGFVPTSPFAIELARALEANGVDVVDSTLEAARAASSASVPTTHIVIDGLMERRDAVVATTTAYGQVRDMTVRNDVTFRVLRADGTELMPPSIVGLAREMTYNERDALAKQDETEALHKAMQNDLVNQVLRRLAAIKPGQLISEPPPPAAGASSSAPALPEPSPASSVLPDPFPTR